MPKTTQTPQEVLAHYNEIMQSHKRLPIDVESRLQAGDTVAVYNGTEPAWTSKLILTMQENTLRVEMILSDALPAGMKEKLEAKKHAFLKKI